MFGLGFGELAMIAIVALLFVGPDKLPAAAKTLGKGIRTLRKQTRDLKDTIEQDTDLGDAMREIRSALNDEPAYRRPGETPSVAADADSDVGNPLDDAEPDDSLSEQLASLGIHDGPLPPDMPPPTAPTAPTKTDDDDDDDDSGPLIRPATDTFPRTPADPSDD